MKLLEKAYRVWVHSDIGEYPVFRPEDVEIIYAKNKSQAKGTCDLRDAKNEYDEPAQWIDIKCRRVKDMDKLESDGHPRLRFLCDKDLKREKRNKALLSLSDSDTYYVQDASQYLGNLVFWWGKNNNGYTTYISNAEIYTKQEIIKRFTNFNKEYVVWNSKHVEENITRHVDIQNLDRALSV